MSVITQKTVLDTMHALSYLPMEVISKANAKFKYGIQKNINSLESEIKIISGLYDEDLKPVVDALDSLKEEKTAEPKGSVTICGVKRIPVFFDTSITPSPMDAIMEQEEINAATDKVLKEIEEGPTTWTPYKISVNHLPDNFPFELMGPLDILIKEE